MLILPVLFIAVVAVGFSSILIRLSSAPALVISFYRLGFTVLILVVPMLVREWREIKRLAGRDWLLLGVSGLALALHFYSWVTSLHYTTVASSTVLVTANPFIVLLLELWLLKERTNRTGLLAMVMGVVGAVIVGWGDFAVSGTALFGDILAGIGAVTVSVYTMAGRVARKRMSAMLYSTVVFAIASAFLWLFTLPQRIPLAPYPPREWLLFVALAVIPTVFGHTLLNWALAHVSASTVSMSVLGEPVIATIAAWFLFGEKPGWSTLGGGLLLLAGIWLFVRHGSHSADVTAPVGEPQAG